MFPSFKEQQWLTYYVWVTQKRRRPSWDAQNNKRRDALLSFWKTGSENGRRVANHYY